MFQGKNHRTKRLVDVELLLDNGTTVLGKLSVLPEQRISDLLNDERQFLPIETSDGQTVILRKSAIYRLLPLKQNVAPEKRSDPYEILGVPRNIGDEELAGAYWEICRQNHPDRIQASGMSAPFLQLAHSRMVLINDANRRIVDARKLLKASGSN